jgi:hypothetical protein
MRSVSLLGLAVLFAAASAAAALPICSECLLGVYDDAQLTRTSGTAGSFELKSVYLGIRLPAGVRIRSLGFTAVYPSGFSVIDWTSYVNGVRVTPVGSGVRVEWPECIAGTRLLFRVRVFGFGLLRDAVLQLRDATATSCDGAQDWRVPAGCYILNPSGPPVACGVGTEPSTWSVVKELFR